MIFCDPLSKFPFLHRTLDGIRISSAMLWQSSDFLREHLAKCVFPPRSFYEIRVFCGPLRKSSFCSWSFYKNSNFICNLLIKFWFFPKFVYEIGDLIFYDQLTELILRQPFVENRDLFLKSKFSAHDRFLNIFYLNFSKISEQNPPSPALLFCFYDEIMNNKWINFRGRFIPFL